MGFYSSPVCGHRHRFCTLEYGDGGSIWKVVTFIFFLGLCVCVDQKFSDETEKKCFPPFFTRKHLSLSLGHGFGAVTDPTEGGKEGGNG